MWDHNRAFKRCVSCFRSAGLMSSVAARVSKRSEPIREVIELDELQMIC